MINWYFFLDSCIPAWFLAASGLLLLTGLPFSDSFYWLVCLLPVSCRTSFLGPFHFSGSLLRRFPTLRTSSSTNGFRPSSPPSSAQVSFLSGSQLPLGCFPYSVLLLIGFTLIWFSFFSGGLQPSSVLKLLLLTGFASFLFPFTQLVSTLDSPSSIKFSLLYNLSSSCSS